MKKHNPLFSIIVPTRNRPEQLLNCLNSIACLNYPKDHFEILIVDDGSQAYPASVIKRFKDRLDIILIEQSRSGPAAARNAGARKAKGSYLAFTDDDCMPAQDWLERLRDRFERNPNDAIGGRTVNALPDNPFAATSQIIIDAVYGYKNRDPEKALFFASNNLALPARVFRAVGGFHPGFVTSEDREFCDRLVWKGYGMVYDPEIVIYHAHDLGLASFWRQHLGYGRGALRFRRTRATRRNRPMEFEPLSFYADLFLFPLSKPGRKNRALIEGLLIMSQFSSLLGYLSETRFKG
jgi:GT2 family glycosyltransferase